MEIHNVTSIPKAEEPATQWHATAITVAGYVMLALVQVCVATMSWAGLVGFATDTLRLADGAQYMVPISLDGASMAAAFLALRSVIRGDSAAGARFMVLGFTAASAWFNYEHAQRTLHDTNAAVFFVGMSVAALMMFDQVLRQMRRHALKDIGAVEEPIARFRFLRWVRYPRETFAAWSVALQNGYTRPNDALKAVWNLEDARQEVERISDLESLEGMNKVDAARAALTVTRGNVPAALEWLADRGMTMNRSYGYEIARQMRMEKTTVGELAS